MPTSTASPTPARDSLPGKGLTVAFTYPFAMNQAEGGTRMNYEIGRHLVQRGCRVIVMPVETNGLDRCFPRKPLPDSARGHDINARLEAAGIEVEPVPQSRLHFELDGLQVRRAIRRRLQQEPIDVVLSWFREAAFLPSLLRSRHVLFGYMAAMQSYEFQGTARGLRWRLSNYLLMKRPHRRAELLLAPSLHTSGELQRHLGVAPDRIVLCPLGVDPAFHDIPRPRPDAIRRILFIGRIVPTKGYLDALEALGRLARRGVNDWQFRMVGRGWDQRARDKARELGIGDRVEVLPPVDDTGVRRVLGEADLAIMPSRHEAFGLTFAETQAAGVPVIGWNACAVPEVVEDGVSGWLAPLDDVEGLTDRLQQAIDDPEATHRAGLRGRERVARLFTWHRTADTIIDAVRRLRAR